MYVFKEIWNIKIYNFYVSIKLLINIKTFKYSLIYEYIIYK